MDGIIIIDKPEGWTSHDVVAKLRGALQQKRIGHGGTLDPMATGVLPLFVGRATRAAEYCENADKEYIAGLKLGIVTDTQDATGKTIGEYEVKATMEDLLRTLPRFLGKQNQIPPMYSAIKISGKKLYELARKGIEIDRPAREVYISDIELLDSEAVGSKLEAHEYLLRISCSKGTYVRTLCHDIGTILGCGGIMSSLRRVKAGAFTISMGHSLNEVLSATASGEIGNLCLPIDTLFMEYPCVKLGDEQMRKCKNGAPFVVENIIDGTYRFYGPANEFLMLGRLAKGIGKTIKSFYSN